MEKKKSTSRKLVFVATGMILTVVGFIFIPPFIQKCGNKVYKSSLKKEKIDFDEMGPEIISQTEDQEEKQNGRN